MKKEFIPVSKGLLIVYRFIAVLCIVLVVVLAAGTIYGIIRPPESVPLFHLGETDNGKAEDQGGSPEQGQAGIFTGVGRLRIPAGGSVVILSISFPYPADDRPFTEELDSRINDFRSIALEYFSTLPHEQIVRLDEGAAKAEILRRYNMVLRLGSIDNLYFNDFMIIE